MKRFLPAIAAVCLAVAASAPAVVADERADALARGGKLFADPGLGANGKSCATCHGDGKVWAGTARFPKIMSGAPRTLDQMIQICISSALGAKPVPWDDARLADLALFVDAAYAPKK